MKDALGPMNNSPQHPSHTSDDSIVVPRPPNIDDATWESVQTEIVNYLDRLVDLAQRIKR